MMKSASLFVCATGLFCMATSTSSFAGCLLVKIDPKCWGDTCPMRCVTPQTTGVKGLKKSPYATRGVASHFDRSIRSAKHK